MTELDKKLKTEFENLPSNFWDFKKATTRDLTHGLHSYPATMVYPISQNIIKIIQKHVKIETLFDPFMGSGTVLVEGMMDNIKDIYGTDLNPLAVLMSKVKTTLLNREQLKFINNTHLSEVVNIMPTIQKLANDFNRYIKVDLKLDITAKKGWGDSADKYIDEYFKYGDKQFKYDTFSNLGFWFTPSSIIILQNIKDIIQRINDTNVKNFLLLAFSEVVRTVSNTRNSEFKLFRMQNEKVSTFEPDVFNEYFSVLKRNLSKMEDFIIACKNKSHIHISYDDTRTLNSIPNDCIDLVITSPPYGDSRTTVAYGQFSRLSLQWLNLEDNTQQNIAQLDKSLLGGKPYIDKQQWELLGSPTLIKSLSKIANADMFRADDVFSFYLDLDKCLFAISLKMKKGSYQFWVVGNRTVKLETLMTDKIICELATKHHLIPLFSFSRNILNKAMPSLNSPTNETGLRVKTMTTETVIVLKKE